MIDVIRSEWVKLRTVTSTNVLLLSVVLVSIGFGLLATIAIPLDDPSLDLEVADRLTLALTGMGTSLLLLAVIGVLLVTQEFRYGTIRVTFAAVPRRPPVVVAKALVLLAVSLVVSVAMVAVTTLLGAAILSARDAPIDFGLSGTTRVLVGSVVLGVLYTLFGLAVGTLVRSQPLAIVVVILWPLVVEGIFGGIFPAFGKWLPFGAAGQLQNVAPDPEFFNPWVGGVYLAIVVAALLVAGTVLLQRRDA